MYHVRMMWVVVMHHLFIYLEKVFLVSGLVCTFTSGVLSDRKQNCGIKKYRSVPDNSMKACVYLQISLDVSMTCGHWGHMP